MYDVNFVCTRVDWLAITSVSVARIQSKETSQDGKTVQTSDRIRQRQRRSIPVCHIRHKVDPIQKLFGGGNGVDLFLKEMNTL